MQLVALACCLALANAGNSKAAKMAMMAITTNSSIKVNPSAFQPHGRLPTRMALVVFIVLPYLTLLPTSPPIPKSGAARTTEIGEARVQLKLVARLTGFGDRHLTV